MEEMGTEWICTPVTKKDYQYHILPLKPTPSTPATSILSRDALRAFGAGIRRGAPSAPFGHGPAPLLKTWSLLQAIFGSVISAGLCADR